MQARFLHSGDTALLVEFGDQIDLEINKRVGNFLSVLKKNPIDGIVELLPTYRSINIFFRPEIIRYDKLVQFCKELLKDIENEENNIGHTTGRVLEIPILFGGKIGDELEDVAKYHNVTSQQLIDTITSRLSRVYMIGFLPGLAYMSQDNGLTMPRHTTPRLSIPGGSFVVANNQTNIMDRTSPTGWHPIGHTPLKQFDIEREEPFLFQPGDWCRFVAVTQDEYERIKGELAAGSYKVNISYKEVE